MNYRQIADLFKIRIGRTYKLLYRAVAVIKAQAKEFEKKLKSFLVIREQLFNK